MLGFLTGDLWRLVFRRLSNEISALTEFVRHLEVPAHTDICLFSGGLDSFIGAVDLLARGSNPLLVSHSWVASDSSHQSECIAAIRGQYGQGSAIKIRSRIG